MAASGAASDCHAAELPAAASGCQRVAVHECTVDLHVAGEPGGEKHGALRLGEAKLLHHHRDPQGDAAPDVHCRDSVPSTPHSSGQHSQLAMKLCMIVAQTVKPTIQGQRCRCRGWMHGSTAGELTVRNGDQASEGVHERAAGRAQAVVCWRRAPHLRRGHARGCRL